MAGRFEGVSDVEWQLFADIFPSETAQRGRGMPRVSVRKALNSLLYILITGCRWCDIPRGKQWAAKSSAHRALKRWITSGTIDHLQSRILMLAQQSSLIEWRHGAVDGSFSPWQGRWIWG